MLSNLSEKTVDQSLLLSLKCVSEKTQTLKEGEGPNVLNIMPGPAIMRVSTVITRISSTKNLLDNLGNLRDNFLL